jgi:hypothetical protein
VILGPSSRSADRCLRFPVEWKNSDDYKGVVVAV